MKIRGIVRRTTHHDVIVDVEVEDKGSISEAEEKLIVAAEQQMLHGNSGVAKDVSFHTKYWIQEEDGSLPEKDEITW